MHKKKAVDELVDATDKKWVRGHSNEVEEPTIVVVKVI
jgi:hypothetical protein